jgi:hypothetical protein
LIQIKSLQPKSEENQQVAMNRERQLLPLPKRGTVKSRKPAVFD